MRWVGEAACPCHDTAPTGALLPRTGRPGPGISRYFDATSPRLRPRQTSPREPRQSFLHLDSVVVEMQRTFPNATDLPFNTRSVDIQVAGVLGPAAGLLGLEEISWLAHRWIQLTGVGVALLGIAGTFLTQLAMGENWRIGVDETERTDPGHDRPVRTGPQPHPHRHAHHRRRCRAGRPQPRRGGRLGAAACRHRARGPSRRSPYLRRHHGQQIATTWPASADSSPGSTVGPMQVRPTFGPAEQVGLHPVPGSGFAVIP